MFVGFNTKINEKDILAPYYREAGANLFSGQRAQIKERLHEYILDENIIQGSKLEEDWFPVIEADVFMSHSHKDKELAICFAGWLYELFGIVSFIDSCVWGYSDDLLKNIDKHYCVSKRDANGEIETYSYTKRNQSTAHVYMILNAALEKMIDRTECLMFLNTPNSMLIDNVISGSATASPWIYSELLFSRLVEKKKLQKYRSFLAHDSIHEFAQLQIKYDVSVDHLIDLNGADLFNMWKYAKSRGPTRALDWLYEYKGLIKNGKQN